MLIDSHAHLDMGEFEDDLEGVIKRALDNSVEYIVSVGADLDSSRKAVELSKRFDRIYSTVGIHPHEAKSVNADTFDLLKGLTGSKKVVAWCEIGLDYHYDNSPREIQRSVFREQIRIAMSLGLPLVIHTREAREDTLAVLREEDAGKVGGVFHCFSGDIDMARIAVEMGFYISFSGIITFPKAGNIRE
ncbi:MAG TPA: TatD family hydrolase, partial [Nitrospiria bacterium]|nr:TatD family hydrolase [Nitrospiria bacterium]